MYKITADSLRKLIEKQLEEARKPEPRKYLVGTPFQISEWKKFFGDTVDYYESKKLPTGQRARTTLEEIK